MLPLQVGLRAAARTLWLAMSSALYIISLLLIWRASRNRKDSMHAVRLMPLECSLIICLLLIIGPLTPKIYFIQLLWPVVCLATFALSCNDSAAKLSKYILLFIAVANFLLPLLPGRTIQRLFIVIGIDFYLTCLLAFALMCALMFPVKAPPNKLLEPTAN